MKSLKKIIRNYRVYTNDMYRWSTNILLPVVLGIIVSVLVKNNIFNVALLLTTVMLAIEIGGDYFGIGCICKKNSFGMEFLKCSYNGIEYFEDCLLVDILIRIPRITVFFLIAGFPFRNINNFPLIISEMIAVVCIVSIGGLNIMRYVDMSQFALLVTFILEIPAVLGCILSIYNKWTWVKWVYPPALVIILTACVAGTYYHMIIKTRNSYKDI